MENMLTFTGEPGKRTAQVSLTAPAPVPPPRRPVAEIAAELALQQQLVDAMTDDILPRAEASRDALREAFGAVQARVDALGARIALAHRDEQARRERAGEDPQWAVITPHGAAAGTFGLSGVDRLLLEAQALREREWGPANTLWLNQEHHVGALRVRLSVEQQRLAALDGELTQARAAETVPPADPEAPGGRLYELRQRLSRMGVGPRP